MRATKSKKSYKNTEEDIPYEKAMRSKSPIKEMFRKTEQFKIHDKEVPGGKFNYYIPKNPREFNPTKYLDNDDVEESYQTKLQKEQELKSNSPNRPKRPEGSSDYVNPTPKKGNVKKSNNNTNNNTNNLLNNEREMTFDKKKGIKGRKEQTPEELYGDDDIDVNKSNNLRSNFNTNKSNKSLLTKDLNKSTRSIMTTETTNPEKLQFVKKCRKLRGYALLESLFSPLYKTLNQGLRAFE